MSAGAPPPDPVATVLRHLVAAVTGPGSTYRQIIDLQAPRAREGDTVPNPAASTPERQASGPVGSTAPNLLPFRPPLKRPGGRRRPTNPDVVNLNTATGEITEKPTGAPEWWSGFPDVELRAMQADRSFWGTKQRVLFAARLRANAIGHAEFGAKELGQLINEPDGAHLRRGIRDAVDGGYLMKGSGARCLIVPPSVVDLLGHPDPRRRTRTCRAHRITS